MYIGLLLDVVFWAGAIGMLALVAEFYFSVLAYGALKPGRVRMRLVAK
jgi:hypothetical protein